MGLVGGKYPPDPFVTKGWKGEKREERGREKGKRADGNEFLFK